MDDPRSLDQGFTLVELMVVVLIIGILLTIVIPTYTRSRLEAEATLCQASQRTIVDAIEGARAADVDLAGASAGELAPGGSGWHEVLIPGWIKTKPTCSVGRDDYLMALDGDILGDQGATPTFKQDHRLR